MSQDDGREYFGGSEPPSAGNPYGPPGSGQTPPPYGTSPLGPTPQGMPYGSPQYQPPPPPGAHPGPYGPPPYGYPYPPPQRTNGLAVASMVLGILWLYWIGSILALVFGYIAKRQIRERGEGGGGMATAGIVLGWIGVAFLVLALGVGVAGVVSQ